MQIQGSEQSVADPRSAVGRKAVLYARVSSKEQDLGYSIAAQQALLRRYGSELKLAIEEFSDIETAKTVGRPGFNAMLSYLGKPRDCRVVLVEKTDRLYRNLKDWVTLDETDLEVHFVKENVILTKESRSSEKFMHGLNVLMAKNYIDNLSEEVKKGVRTKAGQGLWPSYAPLGYVNTVRADGKRIIVPDVELGAIVTKLFEWFASGEYSLKTLSKKAYEEGFHFRKSRGKIPVTTLHKTLRKRIYMGEFDYGGQRYQGNHEPLVTREVWDRVQEILDGRHAKKHRKVTHDFVYSGMVGCGHCGCSLVGEVKKGRYVYYHCTGYRGKCPEPYTREEILEQQFAAVLRSLVVPPAVLRWLQSELVVSDQTEQAARAQAVRRQQMELERLQARIDVLYDDRLDGRIDAATYDKKAGAIREQQDQLRQKMRTAEAMLLPAASEAVDLMALTSRAADLFVEQVGPEQRKLLHLVLKEASWKEGELRMSLRDPFEELRLSNSVSDRNSRNFAPNGPIFDNWRRGGDSNSRYP
jgi:DNA invertase Pin-like site-specific DNA recombinase